MLNIKNAAKEKLETAKESDKNIGSNCILILGKENFCIFRRD